MAEVEIQQPAFRFLNLLRFILFIDFVSSCTLWLAAGDSSYLEDNVTKFEINLSAFDLAVMRALLAVILAWLYTKLESLARKRVQGRPSANGSSNILHWSLTFLLNAGGLGYSIAKFIMMHKKFKEDSKSMHTLYYALAISSLVFSGIEFVLFFVNIVVLKKLSVRHSRLEAHGLEDDSKAEGKEKKKADLGRLFSLAKPEAWLIIVGTIGLIGSSGSQMVAPIFFGKVIDSALKPTMGPLNKTILLLFIIYTVGGISAFFRTWMYTLAGQRLVARLRRELFTHIISQEVGFFDSTRTGELMNRLSSDSQVIQNAVTVNISMLVRYALQILGSLAIMFAVSPKLTGVLLSVVPFVAIGAQRYGSFMRDIMKRFQDKLADAATTSEESIGNIRTVKAFSQEPKTSKLYAKDINESYSIGAQLALMSGFFQAGMSIFAQGAVVLVLWYGGKLVHDGDMTLGTLTAFMLYTLNVAMAFAFLSSLYGDFMKAVGASVRIFELFDRVPLIQNGDSRLPSLEGVPISFDEVSFRYPSRPETNVLTSISFCIKPGETVALVGPSGGGKSTVIGLIERFYDPDTGAISIGSVPLRHVDLNMFRIKIGIVNQEPILFATTIAENIAYGKEATREEERLVVISRIRMQLFEGTACLQLYLALVDGDLKTLFTATSRFSW
eukprot:gene14227-15710_t